MPGIELAASVIAVINLSAKVAALCCRYSSNVKNAKDDISRLQDESTRLEKTLQHICQLLESPSGERLAASQSLRDAVQECTSELKRLDEQLDPGKGRKPMSHFGLRALKWPLKSKDVDHIVMSLDRQRNTIVLVLEVT